MKISPEEAKTILLRAGVDIRSIEVPASGSTRSVFSCDVGGRNVYVTLLRPQDSEILYFLHRNIGLQSLVPLAEIVTGGHDEQSKYSYLIQKSVAGQNLQAAGNMEISMLDVGRQLRKIHSLELPGFGKIKRDKTGKFRGSEDSWADFLRWVASAEKIGYLFENGVLNDEQRQQIVNTVDELSDTSPKCGVLLHRDYNRGNICSVQGKVTGIIDWEKAAVGVAEYDLALSKISFQPYFPKLLTGYGSDVNLGWVDKYGLIFATHLVFEALTKRPEKLPRAKNALEKGLIRVL
ncbi:aminoglycoside phosphotransferase family protein [Falsihalocynthiibacter sp. S25ZX9]|uniref:aminoglycoside phosphotransferase family protein n=1 Tax=unclassified Falsihalocynthiibacter TaxID=2854191 RepID=UPI00350FF35C